jgi:hypothetical protein
MCRDGSECRVLFMAFQGVEKHEEITKVENDSAIRCVFLRLFIATCMFFSVERLYVSSCYLILAMEIIRLLLLVFMNYARYLMPCLNNYPYFSSWFH